MSYSKKNSTVSTICDVQIGYTARSRLEEVDVGGVPAVQLRDLRGEEVFDPSGAPNYPLGASFDRYWAGPGDVLFRSRGDRNTAVLIDPTAKGAAIAVMPLVILRPKKDLVDPAYLVWFFNLPSTQLYFDKCAVGSGMRMIPRPSLDRLEVPLPSLEEQRLVGMVDMLAKRERALAHQLAEKKFEIQEFALLRQVRNAQPHGNGTGRNGRSPRGEQT